MYGQLISILIPGNSELEIGLKSPEFIPNLYEVFDEQAMGLFMSPHYNGNGSNDDVAELNLTLKCTQGMANFLVTIYSADIKSNYGLLGLRLSLDLGLDLGLGLVLSLVLG